MAVEMLQDDVWWMGVVLRKTVAGVHVYMPGASGHAPRTRPRPHVQHAY
jgi:hypothetical protein